MCTMPPKLNQKFYAALRFFNIYLNVFCQLFFISVGSIGYAIFMTYVLHDKFLGDVCSECRSVFFLYFLFHTVNA